VNAFAERDDHYMGRPDELALKWLRQDFATSKDDIQCALDALAAGIDDE